jgi:nucleotide-binding universal stress UspA family protein
LSSASTIAIAEQHTFRRAHSVAGERAKIAVKCAKYALNPTDASVNARLCAGAHLATGAIDMSKRILVPLDFSDCSREALRFAVELAPKLDAEVDVLHIWEATPHVTPTSLFWLNVGQESFWDRMKADLEKQLREMVDAVDGQRAVVREIRADADYVAGGIVRRLEQGDYDMCVVGTHGRTGLAHVLIGSVAERVVRTAPCPVVTVPTRDKKKRKSKDPSSESPNDFATPTST